MRAFDGQGKDKSIAKRAGITKGDSARFFNCSTLISHLETQLLKTNLRI